MNSLVLNDNIKIEHFGKHNRVAVTFKRSAGLWHAHAALLPHPQKNIRVARQMVAQRLQKLAAENCGN